MNTDQERPPAEGPDDPAYTGELSENDFSGGESSPPGTPDEAPPQNEDENDNAQRNGHQTEPTVGEGVEDL